jgi:hypothetical protein
MSREIGGRTQGKQGRGKGRRERRGEGGREGGKEGDAYLAEQQGVHGSLLGRLKEGKEGL